MTTPRIAIFGASGYSGEELLRLLIAHPGAHIAAVTSRQSAGQTIAEVYPAFARRGPASELRFTSASAAETVAATGATHAFLALPHGLATEFALPLLEAGVRVLDLSADFRLRDPATYHEFYGAPHPAPRLLSPEHSVYGLPERHREAILRAPLVACPGCYPTSILLPLLPLLDRDLLQAQSIVVTSLSGVTGAGRKAEIGYLYAECNENARPYSVPKHRHLSEIEQELSLAARETVRISFTPILAPLNRGMLSTIYAEPAPGVTAAQVESAWAEAYSNCPFVRPLPPGQLPAVRNVAGSNFLDIAVRHDPRTGRLVLMSAQDNLGKGAAGQAVQCFNLLTGQPETTALL